MSFPKGHDLRNSVGQYTRNATGMKSLGSEKPDVLLKCRHHIRLLSFSQSELSLDCTALSAAGTS